MPTLTVDCILHRGLKLGTVRLHPRDILCSAVRACNVTLASYILHALEVCSNRVSLEMISAHAWRTLLASRR